MKTLRQKLGIATLVLGLSACGGNAASNTEDKIEYTTIRAMPTAVATAYHSGDSWTRSKIAIVAIQEGYTNPQLFYVSCSDCAGDIVKLEALIEHEINDGDEETIIIEHETEKVKKVYVEEKEFLFE